MCVAQKLATKTQTIVRLIGHKQKPCSTSNAHNTWDKNSVGRCHRGRHKFSQSQTNQMTDFAVNVFKARPSVLLTRVT